MSDRLRSVLRYLAIALTLGTASSVVAQPSFKPLGFLPGATAFSFSTSVSADGSVVVGYSNTATTTEAFRWTQPTGTVALTNLPGGTASYAFGVSSDGNVILGLSELPAGTRAFRWTQATGMTNLGLLAGGTDAGAATASANGSVVVGQSGSTSGQQAFRFGPPPPIRWLMQ